jgi:hypothetical protein
MAIKISGTTVISDDRDITNIIDMTVSGNAVFSSTGALTLPTGNTAQQPAGAGGNIRYNSETDRLEFYSVNVSGWRTVGSGSGATSADSIFIASS